MELKFSIDNITESAISFWKNAGDKKVFAFHGEMGSGKTAFIRELCMIRGTKDTITSPTFSLINEYDYRENGIDKKIFHLDLYRLKDEEEAIKAGIEDCLYSENICMVEWPEKAPRLLPADTLHVHIEIVDEKNRKLRTDDKIS